MQDFDTLPCSCNCTGAPQPTGLSPSRFAPSRFTLTTPRPKPRCGAVGPTVPKANRHLRSGSNTLTRESSSKGISAQETITNQALPVGSKKPHPENKRGAGGFAAPMTRALASMVRSIDIPCNCCPPGAPQAKGPSPSRIHLLVGSQRPTTWSPTQRGGAAFSLTRELTPKSMQHRTLAQYQPRPRPAPQGFAETVGDGRRNRPNKQRCNKGPVGARGTHLEGRLDAAGVRRDGALYGQRGD